MASAPILALPLVIISGILKELPQAEDLLSAACTHSLFYEAIKQDEDAICEAVSLNIVNGNLYPYAIAAYHIRSRPFDEAFLCDVLSDMHYRIFDFPTRGTRNFKCHASLRSALHITNLQQSVFHFNLRFEGDTLMRADLDLYLDRQQLRYQLSNDEIFLVQRALFRFQIYCEIAMAGSKAGGTDGSLPLGVFTDQFCDLFLGYLPPWVNEQLACVHDCLEHFLLQKFGRIARHDVEWGAREMQYPPFQHGSPYIRGMLTYGLRFLEKVDRAGTYDEIQKVLTSVPLAYSNRGLDFILKWSQPWHWMKLSPTAPTGAPSTEALGIIVPQVTMRAFRRYCKRMEIELPRCAECKEQGPRDHPHPSDPKPLDVDCVWRFPFRIWRLACQAIPLQDTGYHSSLRLVRLTGYVLWEQCEYDVDGARTGQELVHLQHISEMHYSERAFHHVGERVSWRERTEIYKKGGRGYWSEDGVHAITWTNETVDNDGIDKLRKDFKDMTIPLEQDEVNSEHDTAEAE